MHRSVTDMATYLSRPRGGGGARRQPADALRLRQPRPDPLRARGRGAAAALPRRGRLAAQRAQARAARSGAGGARRPALGHAGARVAPVGHPRRAALLRRARRGGAGGAGGDRGGGGAAVDAAIWRLGAAGRADRRRRRRRGAARQRWRGGCRRSTACSSSCRWRRRTIRSPSICGRTAVRRAGARILRVLAAAAVGARPTREPVARVLQRRWAPRDAGAARAARRRVGALRRQRPQPVELHGPLRRLGGLDALRGGHAPAWRRCRA